MSGGAHFYILDCHVPSGCDSSRQSPFRQVAPTLSRSDLPQRLVCYYSGCFGPITCHHPEPISANQPSLTSSTTATSEGRTGAHLTTDSPSHLNPRNGSRRQRGEPEHRCPRPNPSPPPPPKVTVVTFVRQEVYDAASWSITRDQRVHRHFNVAEASRSGGTQRVLASMLSGLL